jgi:LacI family repressor for deo operon, udp, cdd, tsx, nupC, and nupG
MVYRDTKNIDAVRHAGGRARAQDVAEAAGVSKTTVVSILSGRNVVRVSEETRQRVVAAANEMGYRRNGLASALRTGRTNTIGIVSPLAWSGVESNLYQPYLTYLLAAISVATAGVGMNAMTFIDSPLQELSASEIADGRVSGIVVFGMPMNLEGAGAWMRDLCEMGIPVVEIGSSYSRYQVHLDNENGARLAVEHLIALGHRRIACWTRLNGVVSGERRRGGFLAAVREAGLPSDETPCFQHDDELMILLRSSDRPTAIFCNDDNRALAAYDCIHNAGLRVPEDVSVVAFDMSPACEAMRPRLTSVKSQWEVMAQAAVSLLLLQLEGKEVPDSSPMIDTHLVLRDSTAPYRS